MSRTLPHQPGMVTEFTSRDWIDKAYAADGMAHWSAGAAGLHQRDQRICALKAALCWLADMVTP